jgi:hypothetical protein
MTWEADDLTRKSKGVLYRRIEWIEPELAECVGCNCAVGPSMNAFGESIDHFEREAQYLADLTNSTTRSICHDLGSEGSTVAAVLRVNVLNDLLASFVFKIDVDIGRLLSLFADEASEKKIDYGWIY